MRRLIWGFAGRTYHIVGNLILRLKLRLFELLILKRKTWTWRRSHFPIGTLGQVWCLIVSIPDLGTLSYFETAVEIFGWETSWVFERVQIRVHDSKGVSMEAECSNIIGPRREKTCLRGFRQNEFQTSLLSYRDQLKNWNFACSKYR